MPNRTFLILAAACLTFPPSVSAAQLAQENNSQQTQSAMEQRIAQHRVSPGKRDNREEKMNRILQQLDLTTEQSQKIKSIKEEFRTKNVALEEEIKTNHSKERLSLNSDASPEELRQQHQQVQALHQQLNNNRFEMMLQVRETLTSEQRNQLAELIEQKRNRKRF